VKDSRRRVEFAEPCDPGLLPVKKADVRGSRPADLPEREVCRTPNTRYQRHRSAQLEACATGDPVQALSEPVYKSPPRPTNPAKCDRITPNSVQTQHERRSVRAGSNSSGLRQQPAATPAEEEITFQKPKAELATSAVSSKRRSSTAPAPQSTILGRFHSPRVSKSWRRTHTQVSPEVVHNGDGQWPSKKGKQNDKHATARSGKDLVKSGRKKRHLADVPVRRSPRLEGKPTIHYPR
jgi:hypothetical protein